MLELDVARHHMANPPVNVVQIIRDLGIRFRDQPMGRGKSGFIDSNDGEFTIGVNSSDSSQRQRFTAAHQLAHYLLHRDLLMATDGPSRHDDSLFDAFALNNPPQPFSPRHEAQANRLAVQIITPRGAVAENYVPELDNVDMVAELFGISPAAMSIRLKAIGLRGYRS